MLAHIVKYRDCLHELCRDGRTSRDAVWSAELGGSREHALHADVDAPTEGTFLDVKIGFWGLGKGVTCVKKWWTDLNDPFVV